MSQLFQQQWPWYIAGPLIGLMVPALLLLDNKQFGISSTMRDMCAYILPGKKFAYFNYSLKEHQCIMEFLKDASKCSAIQHTLPQWDLKLVLHAMRRLPLEPMSDDRIQWLTWKTALPVAIVIARCIGGRL